MLRRYRVMLTVLDATRDDMATVDQEHQRIFTYRTDAQQVADNLVANCDWVRKAWVEEVIERTVAA